MLQHRDRHVWSNLLSHLSQYTDARLTSPSTDPVTPGTWQGHKSLVIVMTDMTWSGIAGLVL